MPRVFRTGANIAVFLSASYVLFGQTLDTRLDDTVKEMALLKRMLANQEQRIATLESTVRAQQREILAATRALQPVSSRSIEGWAAVRLGMSRDQVLSILGEPKSTETVIDRQTLYYKDGANPIGQVVITDDRVSEVASPKFQIYIPAQK
jgi:hypothetical protein